MEAFNDTYLEALARRDPSTEENLITVFSRPIKNKLRTHLHSAQTIDDAYQETLLRIFSYFRQGKTLRNPACLPAFIHAVTANVALETVRATRRNNCSTNELCDLPDRKPDPEGATITRERCQTVRRILCEMSNTDRELLRRICLDDEDRDQICHDFRVTREYLRLLLYRARARFRILIQSEPVFSLPAQPKPAATNPSTHIQYRTSGSRQGAGHSRRRALPFGRAIAG